MVMLIFGIAFVLAAQDASATDSKYDFASHPELTNSYSKESGFGFDLGTSVTNVTGGEAHETLPEPSRVTTLAV
jgi:hypothetical protein